MNLKAIIISLVSIFIVGIISVLLYCYWPAIKGTVDDSKYYTAEDMQESYDKGYDDGCKSETELTGQVKYYKDIVDEYYIQVNTLNDEIAMLNNKNNDYKTQITNLSNTRDSLELQVNNLTTIKSDNENTIADLNSQITSLKFQVTTLTNSNEDKSEQIATLNTQITNLQNTVSQLQTTNNLNLQTITSLNTQIASLNSQINEMTMQSQNSNSQINALNNRINELQESINYYESYIASLETSEQVVATFEFDGSVYNIQIVNKGAKVSVVDPTSTDYVIFNYWTVDGEQIDLNTYTLNTNTKIVANVTYKYDVKFVVDGTNYDSQIVTKDNCATLPSNPTKDGYDFDGWSLNGVDVVSNIETVAVTQNVTYTAVFTKLHTVTFMMDGETVDTQIVRNGSLATLPENPNKENYDFDGWTLNETTIVDISNSNIFADTVFTAKFTQLFTVSFAIEQNIWFPEIIYSYQVREGDFATDIAFDKPSKEYYEFANWTIENGWSFDVVNLDSYQIFEDTLLYGSYNKVQSIVWIYDGEQLIHRAVYNVGDTLVLSDITPLGREGCYFVGFYSSGGLLNSTPIFTDLPVLQDNKTIGTSDFTLYAFYSEYCTGQFVSTSRDNSFTIGYDVTIHSTGNIAKLKFNNNISYGVFGGFYISDFDINTSTFLEKQEGTFNINGEKFTGYMEYKGTYDITTDTWTFTQSRILDNGDITVFGTETFVRSGYVRGYPIGNISES